MKTTNRNLRRIIRESIKALQSHSNEPDVGDKVVNVNPGCDHYGSRGVVQKVNDLPNGMGTTVVYKCSNCGPTWNAGDLLQKTLDQVVRLSPGAK